MKPKFSMDTLNDKVDNAKSCQWKHFILQFAAGVFLSRWQHRRSQYELNQGTRLGKILPNTVDFYFFYQTDNIRRFHTADFVQRTVCSPRL